MTNQPSSTDGKCGNERHAQPLPDGYIAAASEANRRLASHWRNVKCPDCGRYGWLPPKGARDV